MKEFVNNVIQSVNLNNPILFDSTNCQCQNRGSKIYHDNGTGGFILSGTNASPMSSGNEYQVTFNGNIAIPTGGTVGPIAVAIVVNGEEKPTSRAIFNPAAVDEYGNVTSTTIVKVPKCCGCFTVAVEYVSGVDDPATTPAPTINVQNANLTIDGKVA
jgi:hypothetical protein